MSGRKPIDAVTRFHSYYVVEPSGCWTWQNTLDKDGYGYLGFSDSRRQRAHRFAWELLRGPIPFGLTIDHLCRNRACVNPDHLEPVTNRENVTRGTSLRTHCRYGHPLDGFKSAGYRYCRTCHRERVGASRAA